jgi:hypothetical protein
MDIDRKPDEEQTEAPLEWREYFYPATMTTLLHKKLLMMGFIVGFYYIVQFMCCVCACNFYSDNARTQPCVIGDNIVLTGEDASAVFDTAIKLTGIFHIIEWIRTTILLVAICIGVNVMQIWYITAISSLYGIAVFIYLHVVYASASGMACGQSQVYRYKWMMVEIIYFWTLFFIFQFPMIIYRVYTKDRVHEILNKEPTESDAE